MNTHSNVVLGGVVATIAMTLLMLISPIMGMPKMYAWEMLAAMMGGVSLLGWMMHFVIGLVFAFTYFFLLNQKLPLENNFLRGAVYGLIVFIFAQIMMIIMSMLGLMAAPMQGGMVLMLMGSIIGHVLYGAVLGSFIRK